MTYDSLSKRWSPQLYDSVSFPFYNYFAFGRKAIVRWDKGADRPVERRLWYFRPREFLKSLFDPWCWQANCFPSYAAGLLAIWNNICVFLTPWYRTRRHLINDLANRNECKVLDQNRKYLCMRDRSGNNAYVRVRFGPVCGEVELAQYVTKDGATHNLFLTGIEALAGKEVEEPVEVRKLLFKAPALTESQCLDFLNRTVKETESLIKWYE